VSRHYEQVLGSEFYSSVIYFLYNFELFCFEEVLKESWDMMILTSSERILDFVLLIDSRDLESEVYLVTFIKN
jgi:hypothetical protein